MSFSMPMYMIDFTTKTIAALTSKDAVNGDVVEVDVYERTNVSSKLTAQGQRLKTDADLFKVTTIVNNEVNEQEWNYTILRESADRSKTKR